MTSYMSFKSHVFNLMWIDINNLLGNGNTDTPILRQLDGSPLRPADRANQLDSPNSKDFSLPPPVLLLLLLLHLHSSV